jgi:hypothetical protein
VFCVLGTFYSSVNVIALEGPADVEAAARKLNIAFAEENAKALQVLVEKLRAEEVSADLKDYPYDLKDYGYEKSVMSRCAAKMEFIDAARTALEPTED